MPSQKKKVQKLSLWRYLFKRYTFVPKVCILVKIHIGTKSVHIST